MVWVILAAVGVPLWLCAVGITVIVFRTRSLTRRGGNVTVRVLRPGKKRWTPGQGLWVSDVFAWRGSPAAWAEDLVPVASLTLRAATVAELKALHRLGDDPAVVVLTSIAGDTLTVATQAAHQQTLLGPFAAEQPAGIASVPVPVSEPDST